MKDFQSRHESPEVCNSAMDTPHKSHMIKVMSKMSHLLITSRRNAVMLCTQLMFYTEYETLSAQQRHTTY